MGVPVLFTGVKRIVDSAANLWYNWQVVGEAVVLRNSNRRCCGLDKLKIKIVKKGLDESIPLCLYGACSIKPIRRLL